MWLDQEEGFESVKTILWERNVGLTGRFFGKTQTKRERKISPVYLGGGGKKISSFEEGQREVVQCGDFPGC